MTEPITAANIPKGVRVDLVLMRAIVEAYKRKGRPLTDDEVLELLPAGSEATN
jgi:hypothetical protein